MGENISNHLSNKGFISRIYIYIYIYKYIYKTPTTKKNLIQKWAKGLYRHFFKVVYKMANKHIKRCSASLDIREIIIKSTMRYHFTSIRHYQTNRN